MTATFHYFITLDSMEQVIKWSKVLVGALQQYWNKHVRSGNLTTKVTSELKQNFTNDIVWLFCLTPPPPEPCQPTGLTVSGSCDNETVVLDWSAAEGASVYMVTASGDLGYVTSFQTNETMIEAELPCGQLFTFTVKAQDNRCNSAVSLPEEFKTGLHLIYIFDWCGEQ